MIITIDGPTASGKSTVGRILADRLNFYYLCSGFLYRAVAYLLVHKYEYTIEALNAIRAEDIAQAADPASLRYDYSKSLQERVFFEDEDITAYLKDKCIDHITSIVSVNKDVRKAVTAMQRDIASRYSIVTDGRDVGSVVFPDAQVKFFITASVAVRAERWRKDQKKYDNHLSIEDAITFITERDDRDKNRTIAPLIIPDNAIVIDTSSLSVDQVVKEMMGYVDGYLLSAL